MKYCVKFFDDMDQNNRTEIHVNSCRHTHPHKRLRYLSVLRILAMLLREEIVKQRTVLAHTKMHTNTDTHTIRQRMTDEHRKNAVEQNAFTNFYLYQKRIHLKWRWRRSSSRAPPPHLHKTSSTTIYESHYEPVCAWWPVSFCISFMCATVCVYVRVYVCSGNWLGR